MHGLRLKHTGDWRKREKEGRKPQLAHKEKSEADKTAMQAKKEEQEKKEREKDSRDMAIGRVLREEWMTTSHAVVRSFEIDEDREHVETFAGYAYGPEIRDPNLPATSKLVLNADCLARKFRTANAGCRRRISSRSGMDNKAA
jgi:hypothetical protein